MRKKSELNQDRSPSGLPEFLDEQAELREGIRLVDNVEQLQELQLWVSQREKESTRKARPAWIEVLQAIINLSHNAVEKGESSIEQRAFETHIVARQAARQRERSHRLATRFVSDEVRRICNRQREYLQSIQDKRQAVAIVGWFRAETKRGLGLVLVDYPTAVALCRCEEEPDRASDEGSEPALFSTLAANTQQPSTFLSRPWLSFGSGFVLALLLAAVVHFSGAGPSSASEPNLVKTIQARGILRCGVDGALPRFSLFNGREKRWWGLDIELCRALAAALDVEVEFKGISISDFPVWVKVLEDREVDILFRNTTLSVARDLNRSTAFGPVYFFERESFLDLSPQGKPGEEFLAPEELEGKKICVKPGTSNERTLQQLQPSLKFDLVTSISMGDLSDNSKLVGALRKNSRLCDFVFGNYYVLQHVKSRLESRKKQKLLSLRHLPDFGLDPLAPVLLVDEQWLRVVSHTIYALMYADQLGINSFNLADIAASQNTLKKDFLSGSEMAKKLDLSTNWIQRIIESVGSYNQIYHRSFVCEYEACELDDEESYKRYLASGKDHWPNKLFKRTDEKPGMLVVPRFYF